MRLLLIIPVFLLSLLSCRRKDVTAYFFISNTSESKKAVDITVSCADKTIFSDTIRWSSIAPDLQYTPFVNLPIGMYKVKSVADNGQSLTEQIIDLTADRWIFISYSYTPPIDSLEATSLRKNGFDSVFIKKQIERTSPTTIIHVMKKEPVHM